MRDVIVIGAGIVGLAVAREVLIRAPHASVLVLEAADDVATGQSGHNSGVVHAGIYYPPGSLKAKLARAGTRAVEEFAQDHDIGLRRIGKLLVATSRLESDRLTAIAARAWENHVETRHISASELNELEPRITGHSGLLSPRTSIVDYVAMCRAMRNEIEQRGGQVRTRSHVRRIDETAGHVRASTETGEYTSRILVACAGTQADRVARLGGLPVDFRIIPFRGEYYQLPPAMSDVVDHLIYPVPDPALPFLGVHLSPTTGGRVTVGPSAVLGLARSQGRRRIVPRDVASTLTFPGFWRFAGKNISAGISELRSAVLKSAYARRVQKYCPEIVPEDLRPYPAGTRAQAMLRSGRLVEDFLVRTSTRQVHVCNAPSPAATAAIPIAEMIFTAHLGHRPPFG